MFKMMVMMHDDHAVDNRNLADDGDDVTAQ